MWAIISRISKFVNSIKFRLTASYLVMLVLSLTVVNFLVISYMGDTLLEQRFSVQQQAVSSSALKIENELGHSEEL